MYNKRSIKRIYLLLAVIAALLLFSKFSYSSYSVENENKCLTITTNSNSELTIKNECTQTEEFALYMVINNTDNRIIKLNDDEYEFSNLKYNDNINGYIIKSYELKSLEEKTYKLEVENSDNVDYILNVLS